MVSREMLFTWSALVTFLGFASAASIVPNDAVRKGDSVIVKDYSKNVTEEIVKNCSKSDYENNISFNGTTEKDQNDKSVFKSVENDNLLPMPISIISDSEFKIPVSIKLNPISKKVELNSSRAKPENLFGGENSNVDLFSISTELLPPKETHLHFVNITNLLGKENYTSITTNTTQNIDSSETTSSQQIYSQRKISDNQSLNKSNELDTPYMKLQKSVEKYDAITTIDETTFINKSILDINVNPDIHIQSYNGSHNNAMSSSSQLSNIENIKLSSETTIQPSDKLYTNAPLATDMITNILANILSSNLDQPTVLTEEMKTIVDTEMSRNENIQSDIKEFKSIPQIYQNNSKPCTPLDQKYPITNVIAQFYIYSPLNLSILPNVSSTESANITSNNEFQHKSMNTDTNNNVDGNTELFSEIITEADQSLSNITTDTLSGIFFSKVDLNQTADTLTTSTGVNSHSVPITIQDQLSDDDNAYDMHQSAITNNSAITIDKNIENDDIQSTETFSYVTPSNFYEELLSSISTIQTLEDSDVLHTEFDSTTTEVIIPEPILLSTNHKNSDYLAFSNLLDEQDDFKETQFSSTTEILLETESTSVDIDTEAPTDNSNIFTTSIMEQETTSNTVISEAINTSTSEVKSNEESSTTTLSSLSNDEQRESTGVIETLMKEMNEDYEVMTDSDLIEKVEVNTKASLLNKYVFQQDVNIISPVSITTSEFPETISTNIKHDKLNANIMPNIFTKNYMINRDDNSKKISTWNENYIHPSLTKERNTYSILPNIITDQPIDQTAKIDETDWYSESTLSDELIITTESVLNTKTTDYVKYTTENRMKEGSTTFKIKTYASTPIPGKLKVTNSDELLTTNINLLTVNTIPARTHFTKTSYIPQQRNYSKIPVTIIHDDEKMVKMPSRHIIERQRKFTDSKILGIESNDEVTKKYRFMMNKERGHIKFSDTVTRSFYEAVTSKPIARRIQNIRQLSDPTIIGNKEKINMEINLVNKIQQQKYPLENGTIESRQDLIDRSEILDKPVYKKLRGNIRHLSYKGISKTTENIDKIVNINQYTGESSRVKSNILNNTNDVKSKYSVYDTKHENQIPRVNISESSFDIPEQILAANIDKIFSTENTLQLNNKFTTQALLQKHETNTMTNHLIREEDPTSTPENTDTLTLVQEEEEVKFKTTVFETQISTTVSPLIVRISKNAGFINNINLKDIINMNVKTVNDEIFQFDTNNKSNSTFALAMEPVNVARKVQNTQLNKYDVILENETNSDDSNINKTTTYNLAATETGDVANKLINDKNSYNIFTSKQGNYFSSVYNSEQLRKESDTEIINNFNLEKQQDPCESVNAESNSNSITPTIVADITISAEKSTDNIITIQNDLKINNSVEDVATMKFGSLEEATTIEYYPTISTTFVPIIKRKRKRRPIRKSIRKFHAISADGNDNLEIINDNNPISRIIRSTTTNENENRKPHIRMRDPIVPIINSDNRVYAHTGHFAYSYESGDGTQAFETGDLKNTDETHAGEAVQGGFSYKDKEGQQFSLEYTADENGYRPRGAHLPTPPPIPPAIARALEYLATKITPEPPTTTKPAVKT